MLEPLDPNHSGDLFTIEEMREHVACGGIMDHDGFGYFVYGDQVYEDWDWRFYPSEIDQVDPAVTHILWFNN
jgi:hypothetical protein